MSLTFRSSRGTKIAADAYGDRSRQPVLFSHGGGQTRGAWGSTAKQIAERGFYAVTIDLPGHGESEWVPDGDYSVHSLGADLRKVAEQVGGAPISIGASLGGLSSLIAEGESGGGVFSGLVLVDVAPRLEHDGVQRVWEFMTARPDGFSSIDEAADAVAAYLPHRPRPKDLSGLTRNLRLNESGRFVWHWDRRLLEASPEEHFADMRRCEEAARRLTLPTMIVRGRMSDVLSVDGVKAFLELTPHARYVDVSRAGHMVAGDQNDAFTEAVLEFLSD